MSALAHQGDDGEVQRRLSRRRRHRAEPAFECGDAFFEDRDGRVRDARIDVAGALEVEEGGGMVRIAKHIGGRLVDRHRPRAGRRVGLLAGMEAERAILE